MSRASAVWVVTQYGQLYASFTVKHELMAWAVRHIPEHLMGEYRVHRMPDGSTFVPGADNQFYLKEFCV